MESVSGSQPVKQTNHKLVYILVALGLVIVGLVIAIIFTFLNNNQQPEPGETDELSCENLENVDNVAECAGDLMFDDDSTAVLDYYEEAIDKALDGGREDDAAYLIITRSAQMAVIKEDCEAASKMYNDLDYDRFSPEMRSYLYSYALNNSVDCGDETGKAKWSELLSADEDIVEEDIGVGNE